MAKFVFRGKQHKVVLLPGQTQISSLATHRKLTRYADGGSGKNSTMLKLDFWYVRKGEMN